MRATLALDDGLIRTAQELTGLEDKAALVREAIKALIERESARKLAAMGGSMPHLKNLRRVRRRVNPHRYIGKLPDRKNSEKSIAEFKRLSGQGDSRGRRFDRNLMHER